MLFGVFAIGAAVAFPAAAVADDGPPDPLPLAGGSAPPPGPTVPVIGAPLGPAGLDVLAQSNAAPIPDALGAPPAVGLDVNTLLGQNAAPSGPGGGPGTPPNLNVFDNAYGAQHLDDIPSAPGRGHPVRGGPR